MFPSPSTSTNNLTLTTPPNSPTFAVVSPAKASGAVIPFSLFVTLILVNRNT
jgi:hypothetical protein